MLTFFKTRYPLFSNSLACFSLHWVTVCELGSFTTAQGVLTARLLEKWDLFFFIFSIFSFHPALLNSSMLPSPRFSARNTPLQRKAVQLPVFADPRFTIIEVLACAENDETSISTRALFLLRTFERPSINGNMFKEAERKVANSFRLFRCSIQSLLQAHLKSLQLPSFSSTLYSVAKWKGSRFPLG